MDMDDVMGGNEAVLTITWKGRALVSQSLEVLTLRAKLTGSGVILPFAYRPTVWPNDDDQAPRPPVYGRLMIEVVDGPDGRTL